MNKLMILLLSLSLFFVTSLHAQLESPYQANNTDLPLWAQLLYGEDVDAEAVMSAYEAYYETNEFVKNSHTQYYKRWLRSMNRAIQPEEAQITKAFVEQEKAYLQKSSELRSQRSPTSAWQGIGPFTFDKYAASTSYAPGAAHVYTVERAASNTNVLYAGTATAGVWKSIDEGMSWDLVTSNLLINSVRSVEIDFTDENVVYFAGGGQLYKSTDGAANWNIIGDAAFTALDHNIGDIVLDPSDNNTLFICSDEGLYKSTNGGNSFTLIQSGSHLELEFKPSDPNTVYTVSQTADQTNFYRSTDGGDTFTQQTTGWPLPPSGSEQKRTEIAVSAAAPNNVYALATGSVNGGSGLYGVYVSTDQGSTWSFVCCGPQEGGAASTSNINMMGWQDNGSDDGGQYYYDLGFDVSDSDPDFMIVGGVNAWYSTDGGATFTCPSKWSHSDKPNYVHADIHDIRFYGDDIWIACDGGIFYSSDDGANMEIRMTGIQGTDFWGFGAGFLDGEVMLGGTYHNATLLKDNSVYDGGWISTVGGDNTRGFVNFGDNRIVYHDNGKQRLSGDRTVPLQWQTFGQKPNASGQVGRSSEIAFHPQNYNIFYIGNGTEILKTVDDGASYESIYDFGADVAVLKVAWDNPDVLYAGTFGSYWGTDKELWRSDDAGLSWTNISPVPSWIPYDVTISSDDPYEIWVARVHHNANTPADTDHLFHSTDGGVTWTNVSSPALAGEFLTSIVHQRGSDGGLYLGTRRAVYYKDNSLADWVLFNNNLPVSTFCTRLIPFYGSSKIRNASNRSVYECDFYNEAAPDAQIAVDKFESFCTRDTFKFVDHSAVKSSGSWSWSFPGGTPATSTDRHPEVVYQNAGTYDVTLTVSDSNGSDTQILTDFITVTAECDVDTIPGNALSLNGVDQYTLADPLNLNSNTVSFSAWIKRNGAQDNWAAILFSRGNTTTNGLSVTSSHELRYHWDGGNYGFGSGLIVPDNEWTHVALVVSPNEATIYMNGIPSTNTTSHAAEAFDTNFIIGLDPNGGARYFDGLIDEVCVWDKSLTQAEVRELMHLTKIPTNDPNLVTYYQYNRVSGEVTDRVGGNHASLINGSTRVISSVPVGGGFSDRLNEANGVQTFGNSTNFTADYNAQNGAEVVSSIIHLMPYGTVGIDPTHTPLDNQYWVLNRYGTGSFEADLSFSTLEDLDANDQAYPFTLGLYHRPFYEDDAWSLIASANVVNETTDEVSFPNITMEGQYYLSRMPLAIQKVKLNVLLQGAFDGGLSTMRTDLYDEGYLPNNQPYSAAPWNYAGTESIATTAYSIVDWLLVEARDSNDDELLIESSAAILDDSGQVRSVDGSLGATFYSLDETEDYYFVIRHRNHLDIMSANLLSVNNTSAHDLTQTANVNDGINQLVALPNGDYAMRAGDFDGNGVGAVVDFNEYILAPSQIENYYQLDCNLDKHTTVQDYNLYRSNASMIGIDQIRY